MATANLLQTSVSGGTQNALSLQGDGVFFPKASTTSRLALTLGTTDKGFIVYDTTDNNIYFWNGAAWESVPSSGDAGANGSVQYNDNGIVSGATNFVYNKATSAVSVAGDLTVWTNKLFVNATGVGVGTTNVLGDFTIQNGSNCRFEATSSAGGTVIENLNNARNAYLNMTMYADAYIFNRLGSEAMRLNSTANLVLAGGTIGANGVGVTFPAVQVASSDANCLDDYEEGTFTPTVTSVGGTGIVYVAGGSDAGKYTKIGNLVSFTVNLNGTYTGTFSYIRITLPFTVGSAYDAVSGYNNSTGLALAGRTDPASARFIVLYPQSSGDLAIYTGSYNV